MSKLLKIIKPKGNCFIVGDIHGNFSKLATSLDIIGFSPKQGDILICVGDLIDRGPESDQVIQFLNYPFVHSVRGNHEEFAIQWGNKKTQGFTGTDYMKWGGKWFIHSPEKQQKQIADRLAELPIAIELQFESHLPVAVVHGNIPLMTSWTEVKEKLKIADPAMIDYLQWDRGVFKHERPLRIPDLRALVVGHCYTQEPAIHGNRYYLDTNSNPNARGFSILDARRFIIKTVTDEEIKLFYREYKTMSDLWDGRTNPITQY